MLSVILLSYQSENKIEIFFNALNDRLSKENIEFECIIMDDGSNDSSFEVAEDLEKEFTNVHAFQLSKNYTSHYSIFAGFSKVNGKCAVALPDDFQVPLDTVVKMYRLWQKGHKVIIPFRNTRNDPIISRLFSNFYYSMMNILSEIKFPKEVQIFF